MLAHVWNIWRQQWLPLALPVVPPVLEPQTWVSLVRQEIPLGLPIQPPAPARATGRPRQPAEARFWAKVTKLPDVDPFGGCWLWTGATNNGGYGLFWTGELLMAAHRWHFALATGQDLAGLHLHHRCSNPACVRPSHLKPVEPREHGRLTRQIALVRQGVS